jgi:hypothetical protein
VLFLSSSLLGRLWRCYSAAVGSLPRPPGVLVLARLALFLSLVYSPSFLLQFFFSAMVEEDSGVETRRRWPF